MSRRGSDRYVSPLGSSWHKPVIDEKAVSRYRFGFDSRNARLKARIDIAAAVYLLLVVVALIMGNLPVPISGTGVLTLISDSYTLRPLLSGYILQSSWGIWAERVLFALLVCAILLHQSRWLKLRIYHDYLGSSQAYKAIWFPNRKPTLTGWQHLWTVTSILINYLVVAGVVAIAAHYLWALRLMPQMHNALFLASLVFGGILLAVIGATSVIGTLESNDAALVPLLERAIIGAMISGGTFGAIIAVGMGRGWDGGVIGFSFGFGLALSTLPCRDLIVRPRQGRYAERLNKVLHPLVYIPLMALGRLVDVPLAWTLSLISPRRKMPPLHPSENWEIYEQVGAGKGYSYGYLRRPKIRVPPTTSADYVRSRLVQNLLKENSWLTKWVKREPVRLLKSHSWEEEDPLDFRRRVRTFSGYMPPFDRVDLLYRRLLSLMMATYVVAYVVELLIGHIVAFAGRPLLNQNLWAALVFGLAVGVLFAFLAVLGRSSFSALMIGLVSGLLLDPTLGLGSGLAFRLAHGGLLFLVTFVLTLVIDTLDKRALGIMGGLALTAGIYLQSLPYLIPN